LQAHGHSRKETAEIVGVAPETISVWKRHPQWQLEGRSVGVARIARHPTRLHFVSGAFVAFHDNKWRKDGRV